MSKELSIKKIDKDFRQVFVGEEPTNIFINNEGKIRTESIKDTLDGELILSPDLILKGSKIHLDGTKDISFDSTASKIRILDPVAGSTQNVSMYHDADDFIVESTDSTNIVLDTGNGQTVEFWHDGNLRYRMSGLSYKHAFYYSSNDYFEIDVDANGATVMKTVDASTGTEGDLSIEADGELSFDAATNHPITFKKGTGFTQAETTYSDDSITSSGGTNDTDIDFRNTNKRYLQPSAGTIVSLNLILPAVSGNFLLYTRSAGSWAITNYKVYESDVSAAGIANVMWSGGTAPTLTNAGYDVLSFYWDATNQRCFGQGAVSFS